MSWITSLLPLINTLALLLIALGYWRSNRRLQEQKALLDLTAAGTLKNVEHHLTERRSIEQRKYEYLQLESDVIESSIKKLQGFKNTVSFAQMLLTDEGSAKLWPIKEDDLDAALNNIGSAHAEMMAKFPDVDLRLLHSAKQAATKLLADIKVLKTPKASSPQAQSIMARAKIVHTQCTDIQNILRDMLNSKRYFPSTECK